jgi:putative transposase
MLTGSPGHLKSFDYLGLHLYFLTFCTHSRARHFVSRRAVEIVLQQFLRAAADEQMELLAYCFMPDHLHLLVGGKTDRSDGLAFIKRAKQLSGFHFKQAFGEKLWQRYGYEHVLRSDEDSLAVARYIVENPLRAGLVERVQDYPYLGSEIHTIEQILEAVQMEMST